MYLQNNLIINKLHNNKSFVYKFHGNVKEIRVNIPGKTDSMKSRSQNVQNTAFFAPGYVSVQKTRVLRH